MFSIKKRIIQKIKFELGITKLEEECHTLFYLFNNCIDITKIPPTKDGDLRKLQQCDTLLLAIFDKLCSKYHLTYWIDYGTLLGAYRHNGFIPWDDDIDISMPREDLNQVIPLMKSEIEKIGLSIRESYMHPLRCLVLGFRENETGIWVDIFPVDYCITDANDEQLLDIYKKYRYYFINNKHLSSEELTKKKKDLLSILPDGDNKYMLPLLEGCEDEVCLVYNQSYVFPLSKMQFEGFDFQAPVKPDLLLQKIYGSGYMVFPKVAVNNHGRSSEISISQRAKANGIDMNHVYQHLLDIYEKIDKETK